MVFTWNHPQLFARNGVLQRPHHDRQENPSSAERFTYEWSGASRVDPQLIHLQIDVDRELNGMGYVRVESEGQLLLECQAFEATMQGSEESDAALVLEMRDPKSGSVLWRGWLVRYEAGDYRQSSADGIERSSSGPTPST